MSTSNKETKNKTSAEQTPAVKKAEKAVEGIFVYIGPSKRGVIQSGTVCRGTRKGVLERFKYAVEKYPEIAELIVKSSDLAAARKKIKNGGNSLSIAYNALLSAE